MWNALNAWWWVLLENRCCVHICYMPFWQSILQVRRRVSQTCLDYSYKLCIMCCLWPHWLTEERALGSKHLSISCETSFSPLYPLRRGSAWSFMNVERVPFPINPSCMSSVSSWMHSKWRTLDCGLQALVLTLYLFPVDNKKKKKKRERIHLLILDGAVPRGTAWWLSVSFGLLWR